MLQGWKLGRPVTKAHIHREAVVIELIEKGFVFMHKGEHWFADGITIRVVEVKTDA